MDHKSEFYAFKIGEKNSCCLFLHLFDLRASGASGAYTHDGVIWPCLSGDLLTMHLKSLGKSKNQHSLYKIFSIW